MIQQIIVDINESNIDLFTQLVDKGIEFDWVLPSENTDDMIHVYFRREDEDEADLEHERITNAD